MRISDWSSDVCSSDLSSAAYWSASAFPARATACRAVASSAVGGGRLAQAVSASTVANARTCRPDLICAKLVAIGGSRSRGSAAIVISIRRNRNDSLPGSRGRSEEHTSELQSLMRISYAVFCLKKKKKEQLRKSTKR